MYLRLITEAIVVGIATVIIGLAVKYLFQKNTEMDMTSVTIFFTTGVLIHLICEIVGVNKWYCKYGNACRK